MTIAPPPAHPAWPPPPNPPGAPKQRRLWPAAIAAAAAGAVLAGGITTAITLAATTDNPSTPISAQGTVTVTAAPPAPPAPLPAAEADAQTCHAWRTTDTLYTAAAAAQAVIPQGTTIDDPVVQANPTWTAGVTRAAQLYTQAADTFASQIAPGTSPMLDQIATTTIGSLRTLSEAFKAFDPVSGNAAAVYRANQNALNWICQ